MSKEDGIAACVLQLVAEPELLVLCYFYFSYFVKMEILADFKQGSTVFVFFWQRFLVPT